MNISYFIDDQAKMQNSSEYLFTTPCSTFVSENLLFFDTFSHSGSEKSNFDLVQFPSPVIIDLIKIVPLGQPIEAKIPGNVRLGATNPSNCELEFFINDLSKEDAHTMTDLGKFFCSEKETDFNPPLQIQTDGLLLRGSYRTLTLAIFGQIATYDEKNDEDQVILSAASPPAQTPASPIASERDLSFGVERSDEQGIIRSGGRDNSDSREGSTIKSSELVKEDSLIDRENIEDTTTDYQGANASRDPFTTEDISISECGPSASSFSRFKKQEDNDNSNSLDADSFDKNFSRTGDIGKRVKVSSPTIRDNVDDDSAEEREWTFNADAFQPKSLKYFLDPSLTLQERNILVQRSKSGSVKYKELVEKEIKRLKELFSVQEYSDDTKSDDWVSLVEDLTNDLTNMSLSQTLTNQEMIDFLIEQVCRGLDMDTALKHGKARYKVRHLRAGIKLATILFYCDEPVISALLQASIPHKLLDLYDRDQMSLPMRLLIFKCMSAACDSLEGVNHIISHSEKLTGKTYQPKQISDENSEQKIEELTTVKTSPPEIETTLEDRSMTCYQALIHILLSKPTTRVTIAIGSLIKKVRLYKNLIDLSNLIRPGQNDHEKIASIGAFATTPREDRQEQILDTIQDIVKLTKDLSTNITQPVRYLPAELQFQVKQSSTDVYIPFYRWLKHFSTLSTLESILSSERVDPHDCQSIVELERVMKLKNLCLDLVQLIIESPQGARLLLSDPLVETTNSLLLSLKGRQHHNRSNHMRMSDEIDACSGPSLYRKDSFLAARCFDIYLKTAYSLKVFQCIDELFQFHREVVNKNGETIKEPEKVLYQLYLITNHPYGLEALIKHLSCVGNLDCLLRFLDMPDHIKQLEFVKETAIDYALELIGTFMRLNNDVLVMSDEYLETIISLSKTKDKNLSVRIKSLIPWLTPFDVDQSHVLVTYNEDTFKNITRVIRKSIPNYSIPFALGLDFELPPKLITSIRILRQLCIPPQVEELIELTFDTFSSMRSSPSDVKSGSYMAFVDSFPHHQNQNQTLNLLFQISGVNGNTSFEDSMVDQFYQLSKLFRPYDESICGELKYHYGIMQVYEQDGYRRLLNTLRELVGNYPHPSFQSAALSNSRGRIVISYIHSVILLLQSMIFHLIDARGSEFQDTSIIPVILETYSLLCFVPKPEPAIFDVSSSKDEDTSKLVAYQKSLTIRSDNHKAAQKTKKLILSILLGYTQMSLSVSESEEKVISKSMWTRMLKEVLDFCMSTPIAFLHGLDILTKILPPPLPGHSLMDSTDQEQLFKNINHRKLWSAHLHPLHQQIEQMISPLSICYDSNIRALLCYFCNQLCDLSSSAACMVVKVVTDSLITYAGRLSRNINGNTSPDQQANASHQSTTILSHNEDKLNQNSHLLAGPKESAYAASTLLNFLANLIMNQAFESAFSNHLHILAKKDDKLISNLQGALKLNEDHRYNDSMSEANETTNSSNCLASVAQLIGSIKVLAEAKDDGGQNIEKPSPPESLTKLNLIELARKSFTDRFSLSSSLKNTYRLKVLLDLKSRESAIPSNAGSAPATNSSSQRNFDHGSSSSSSYNHPDTSSGSVHKSAALLPPAPYVAPPPPPPRTRLARPLTRPDSFRSRPQNTSRPPSIHVDDFMDLYGDSSVASTSSSRHLVGPIGKSGGDYRSNSSRAYPDLGPSLTLQQQQQQAPPPLPHGPDGPNHRHPYFSPPPLAASSLSYSSRAPPQHPKSKYMKLK